MANCRAEDGHDLIVGTEIVEADRRVVNQVDEFVVAMVDLGLCTRGRRSGLRSRGIEGWDIMGRIVQQTWVNESASSLLGRKEALIWGCRTMIAKAALVP